MHFFDRLPYAETLAEVLNKPDMYKPMRTAAHKLYIERHDVKRKCLLAMVKLLTQS